MAQASVWQRLLTDPVDGHLVTQDIKSYRPTTAMRRFLHARTGGVCAARGCGHRQHLQADHVIPFPAGPTSVTNLATLCPGDHNAKTHGGWAHVLDPDTGALTQTSPLGRTYTTMPMQQVAATGRSGDPSRRRPVPIEFDDYYFFPTGEPPPEPAGTNRATGSACRTWTAGPKSPRPSATGPASLAETGAPPKPPNKPSSSECMPNSWRPPTTT